MAMLKNQMVNIIEVQLVAGEYWLMVVNNAGYG